MLSISDCVSIKTDIEADSRELVYTISIIMLCGIAMYISFNSLRDLFSDLWSVQNQSIMLYIHF